MKLRHSLVDLLVIACLLQACAFSRGTLGDEIQSDVTTTIQKGTTTKEEVLHLLGAPDRLLALNGRDVFQYYRYDAKAGSLLLIALNFTRLSIKSDDLFIILDRDGIVEDVISSNRTKDLKFRFWPFGD
ncbi:MAG: hypothetical protein CV081_08330 [Nitrospira sp. LK265]|nr:hypothetical protein [Nitrospira sp.]NGZ60495.1 hypothetical protein [Nitrospira sp. LK265]